MSDVTRTSPAEPITASLAYSTASVSGDPESRSMVPPIVPGYELFEEIGHGGMGVVFRGRDLELNREVAVKVLLAKYGPDSTTSHRFSNEAQITGQLQHPGVPPVYRVGTLPNGNPFLAMKLIKGQTLHDLLKARPNPGTDRGRSVTIFEDVCQAVAYAHTHRVIHRDLKPQNIMVGAFGEVQVMDWGLAKVLTDVEVAAPSLEFEPPTAIQSLRGESSATQAGSLLGTPSFMPPEQAMGAIDEVDAQSDVFGLGAILCVILTGLPPYTGPDAETIRKAAIRADQAQALARLAECGAEPELIGLCRWCLSANKADRPRDAGELAVAVATFRADTEERARRAELDRVRADADRVAASVKAQVERKKRRAQLALAGLALLLVALTGFGAWWAQKQIDDRARLESRQASEKALAEAERSARTERVRANARDAIERAAGFRGQWLWDQAENLLAQAAGQIGPDDDPALAAEIATARRDTKFLARLFDIRMAKAGLDGQYHNEDAPPAYAKAFNEYGYDILDGDPAPLARRLKATAVWAELLVALDDWAWTASIVAGLQEQGERVWAVTSAATGQPNRPGRHVSDFKDSAALLNHVETMPSDELTPSLVSFLAAHMERLRGDKAAVFEAGIRRHPTDFWMHFELGWAYWYGKPRRTDLAIGAFRTSVALRPNVPAARNFLASALFEQDKSTAVVAAPELALRNRVRDNPDDFAAHHELGAYLYFTKHDMVEAAKVFREQIRRRPNDAESHHRLGEVGRVSARYEEAILAHRVAVRLAPDNIMYKAFLGITLQAAGRNAEAIPVLKQVVEHPLHPQHYGYTPLGAAYESEGRLKDAIAAYRQSVRYFSQDPNNWKRLSDASSKANDFATAVSAAREAMRLEPLESYNHYRLAMALDANGEPAAAAAAHRKDAEICRSERRYEHAANAFRRAVALTPRDASLHHELAVTFSTSGDLAAADDAARDALLIDGTLAATHALRGDIARRQFRHDDSLTAYQNAVELAPNDLEFRHSRAAAFQNLGRTHEAEAEYRAILRRNPDRERTLLNLANLLRNRKDYAGAIDALRDAIRINPKPVSTHQSLAVLYYLNGQLPEAVAVARNASERFPGDARVAQNFSFYHQLLAMEQSIPALLAGTKSFSDSELSNYAGYCLASRPANIGLAVRCYSLAQNVGASDTYFAARAAVAVIAGQDPLTREVSLDEWAYLLERARSWLKSDLIELQAQLKDSNLPRVNSAKARLKEYLVGADLRAVRDPAQLARMPDPEERQKWESFWAEVRTAADQAGVVFREVAPTLREAK